MTIQDYLDVNLLQEMLEQKYVAIQTHPSFPLSIYNYTNQTQFDRVWNNVTERCRGLIVNNETNEIVSRPFPKFFNLDEGSKELPNEQFTVTEKMDGSLGITYQWENKWYIATRGSFTSEQSQEANQMLEEYLVTNPNIFKDGITYLFEIIYPNNRIVVDYGLDRKLIMLVAIDNETGNEYSPSVIQGSEPIFPIVKSYNGINDIEELKKNQESNREGYVIRFESGLRVKVKFEEYCKMHKAISGLNVNLIWENLRDYGNCSKIIELVPDEYFKWITKIESELMEEFKRIESISKNLYNEAIKFETRKEQAQYIIQKNKKYSSIVFQMLDNKQYNDTIFKMIRPDRAGELKFKTLVE